MDATFTRLRATIRRWVCALQASFASCTRICTVVDCMRAGLKKSGGSRGGAAPPAGGLGGTEPPPICKRTRFSPSKSFEKKVVQY